MSSLTSNLIILNLFLLQSYLIRFKLGPYSSNLQEILIAVLALTFTISIFQRKKLLATLKNLSKHWIILSFLLLTLISFLGTDMASKIDFYRYLKFLIFGSALTFMALETFQSSLERKYLLKVMGIGALVFGLFSGLYNLSGYNVALDYRLLGPLDSAVYLAFYLTPFFIFFTIESLENSHKKSNLIISIILGLLIIATRSMGAIGGSILVLGFYLLKRSNLAILKSKISKAALVLIICSAIAAIVYTKIIPTIKNDNSSLDERGEIWTTAFQFLKTPETWWTGLGPNQFQQHYFENVSKILAKEPLDYYVLQPHNIFLSFVLNYGILGLVFLSIIILLTLRTILGIKEKANIEQLTALIVSYFLIHGLIDTPFLKNDLLILLILFLELSHGKISLSPSSSVLYRK